MAGRIGFFLQVLPVFAALTTAGQAPSPRELTENMMAAVRQIKTASFTVKKWERINGIIKYSSSDAVMSKNPLQIYMNIKAGHRKGYRFLWIEGDHGGDALVKYPDFPAVNIPVNPRGSLFRYNEHHTIFELGFDYFLKITEGSIHTTGDAYYSYLKYTGDTLYDGNPCAILVFDYPGFDYREYVAKKGETVSSIGAKFLVNDYMLLELNTELDGYGNIPQGKKIKVPILYGKKFVFYLDKKNFLPVVQIIFDEKGIYEKYEFYNLKINGHVQPAILFENKR